MFSGKTTELVRRFRRYELAKKRCILVKHKKDDRYSNVSVVSHDHQHVPAIVCSNLTDIKEKLEDSQIIALDEGQFYPDLFEMCRYLADKGKTVLVAALDATFLRTPFENVAKVCADAESITKLHAVCQQKKEGGTCGYDASFTWRTASREEPIEFVGGSEMYIPVCRTCYIYLSSMLSNK